MKLTKFIPAGAIGAGLMAASLQAQAALPQAVTDAISGAGDDLKTAGIAVITAMAAFWGIAIIGKKLGLWGR